MLKVYYRIIISCWKTFGISHWFFLWLFLPPLAFILVRITLALDEIFFYKYREIKVVKPIFIIGHPRSGTTFLHHLLTQTEEFTTFKAWHIFVPSLTARLLAKPLVDYLVKHHLNSLIPDDIGHGIYIDRVEEEELLFLHQADTQFVLLTTPLAFDDQEHPELRFHDQQPASRRRSSVKFFESCLKRHIYYTGKKQVIAQIHFSTHRINTLLEIFPDAKFIYLVRPPHETIPSHLSLDRNFLDNQWGLKNIPPDKIQRYEERRYRYNVDLYRYFYHLQKNQEIPEGNVMIMPYNLLRYDLKKAFDKIVSFTGINPSDKLQHSIKKQAQQQTKYKRKHRVKNIEEFNLTREQIMKDLSFVYEEYNFDKIANEL
ncbi:sulfotransferase [Moorena producens]|uniref:sulfotransferase n=1 Tax=Moorena producens TaxID=1155739 RepID=UPI003C760DC2